MNIKFKDMFFRRTWGGYNFTAEVECDSEVKISDRDDYIWIEFTDKEITNERLVKFRIDQAMRQMKKRLNLRYEDVKQYNKFLVEIAEGLEHQFYDDDGKEITTEDALGNMQDVVEPEPSVSPPVTTTKKKKWKVW